MRLNNTQLSAYEEQGTLLLRELFTREETEKMAAELERLAVEEHSTNLTEADGTTLRALHGCDQRSTLMYNLVRDPRILEPARQMLQDDVHLFQFKVSMKRAFTGDVWKWHQDFIYWHQHDAMPESRAVTACVYLDDVNEFNAPTWVIPGSHKTVLLPHHGPERLVAEGARPGWHENVVADFKYILEENTVSELVRRNGIVAANGPAGTVLFFHSSAVHASTWNLSPWNRTGVLITYNSVTNRPRDSHDVQVAYRPQFLVTRDYAPLQVGNGI